MKLKFKIVPIYTGAQMNILVRELNIYGLYPNLKMYSPYTIGVYQPNQVLKLGKYGGSLKKL